VLVPLSLHIVGYSWRARVRKAASPVARASQAAAQAISSLGLPKWLL
jgi:hypothetical protein